MLIFNKTAKPIAQGSFCTLAAALHISMDSIYQVIFEDTLAGYWDWNIPEHTEYLSPTFKSMFGYEDHELENKPETWQELIFPEDLDSVLKNFEEHVATKGEVPYKNEVRYRHKNGSTVWVLCTGRVVEWDGDKPVRMVGCHFDITKQKETEAALKITQELLNKTNEAARVGGWEVDLIKQTVSWTKVTKQIHEVDDDYVPDLEKGISFYKEGESRDTITKLFSQAVETGEPFDVELQIVTAKGNTIWIRSIGQPEYENGKCVRVYGSFQDIDEQKRTEEELKLSEIRFEEAFEYSAIGMALVSTEGKWMRLNKRVCDTVGYTNEELLKMTFQDITHPEDLDNDMKHVQDLLKGKIDHYQMEKRYFHKDGHIVWVLLSVSLVRSQKGEPLHFISHIQDITEEKNTTEQLFKANQNLTALYEAMSQVSVISADQDGIIKFFSKGSEELLGYKAEEMIDKQTPAIIHVPEEVKAQGEKLSQEFGKPISGFDVFVEYPKRGRHFSREWTYVRKDGTKFPVQLVITSIKNTKGEIDGFLGIATDISDIKNAQQALALSEKKYRAIFENVQDVFFQTDYAGVVTEISPSIERYSGNKPSEVIGSHVSDFYFNADDRNILMEELKRAGNVNDFEIRMKDVEGELVYVSVNAHTMFGDDGSILGVEGSMRDISDRKQKEIELKDTMDIVGEQNTRLFNFAHIVSHNLRSHTGNLELLLTLLDEAPNKEEEETYLEHIRGVSKNLTETIAHLNEVVSIQTNINQQRKEINLHDYIDNVLNILTADIKRKDAHVSNLVPEDMMINYNEAYMESILLNLISNAIKYRSPERQPVVTIETREVEDAIQLYVSDNGLGIDMKRHGDKLFGMYKTFHGNEDAKGVGLFITKNQIESMGGSIEVNSKLGVGTTFKVTF